MATSPTGASLRIMALSFLKRGTAIRDTRQNTAAGRNRARTSSIGSMTSRRYLIAVNAFDQITKRSTRSSFIVRPEAGPGLRPRGG
jgi:hypothetical protein